jgi:hypothetical protein
MTDGSAMTKPVWMDTDFARWAGMITCSRSSSAHANPQVGELRSFQTRGVTRRDPV